MPRGMDAGNGKRKPQNDEKKASREDATRKKVTKKTTEKTAATKHDVADQQKQAIKSLVQR
jgi:hypothetical protein